MMRIKKDTKSMMNIHFISIGGSAMHNLAIALKRVGNHVTGSDDKVFEPSKSRLEKEGLLPVKMGWDTNNIHEKLDAVILGMHARKDNPELIKAQKLELKIYSYPEFLYEKSKYKKRIVIGGSHGKTTITSMILHAINHLNIDCDYMVGAQLEGYDCMVKISDAPIVILEGDEYLSSPIDLRSKFHLYKPHIALISGIAWDHINVFPSFENYIEQFDIFVRTIEKDGLLVYFEKDEIVNKIAIKNINKKHRLPYNGFESKVIGGKTIILFEDKEYPIGVFGEHNLQNLDGARLILNKIGVSNHDFLNAMKNFKGASKRLELIKDDGRHVFYKDFAHSPSKLKATLSALKKQYPERRLVACMELHTFSSLNKRFLSQYKGSMDLADEAIVYYNKDVIKKKKLDYISKLEIFNAFAKNNLKVYNDSNELLNYLRFKNWDNQNLLMMSSGDFDGINFNDLSNQIF